MIISLYGANYHPTGKWPKDGEKSNQLMLVRLLVGTANLENGSTKVIQDKNFSIVPPCPQSNRTKGVFNSFATNYDLGCNLTKFIKITATSNRPFFDDLLNEFSHYFIQTKQGAHTAAFVYLYRILERISYSVPLLYSSLSTDFIGTFNAMKELFKSDASGELGLFKKFLSQGKFIDPILLDTIYKISFKSTNGKQKNYFKLVNKHFSSFSWADPSTSEVEVKFRDVPSLFITLRNRFFHYRTGDGQDNIALSEIHDPDEFFSCVNEVFCSFLAIVALHAIARTSKA